jgi:glycosyltransferase involved in cell wall biosynthesis
MYCGNCFRDNALVAELRRVGHDVLMLPLYLPLTLDEQDQSAGTPIFFGGINVYLGQKSALFRNAPGWLRNVLASPKLLKWASGRAASTRAVDLGELTISMLHGEQGNQARDLDEMIAWIKTQPAPDVICLSNALLVGFTRKLKAELNAPVVCTLQGEDCFLDALPESHRARAWQTLAERAREVDLFIAPSKYFAELMSKKLRLTSAQVRVVYNGINLDGFEPTQHSKSKEQNFPTLGFFARMCREKGLDTLVDAYIALRKRDQIKGLKLKIGGSCGPADERFVNQLKEQLSAANLLDDVQFHPNLSRAEKISLLKSLSVFSVPATYGEAFGLYVIEALAAGVPVVQPRTAAFPEIIETTNGGVLCEPDDANSLADRIEELLMNPARADGFGERGRRAVFEKFSAERMARESLRAFESVLRTRVTFQS